jgi:tetratricopeptide (TPR) repeat protein
MNAGLARLERATALRPGWAGPHLVMAMAHARRRQHAQALTAFRRALEIDPARVERHPLAIRAATRCFLRRAEQVAGDGRVDVARGLVAEALGLDLRRVDRALRFELERRWDALRRTA